MSCSSNIQLWDSNPQSLEHESSPIATRPGIPPILHKFFLRFSVSVVNASPVEYEYYYEDEYIDEPAPTAPAKGHTKAKDSNYDIEDLVKAWREYLKEKKNGINSFLLFTYNPGTTSGRQIIRTLHDIDYNYKALYCMENCL